MNSKLPEPTKQKSVVSTWVNVGLNKAHIARLNAYYALPWYKRLFKRVPK